MDFVKFAFFGSVVDLVDLPVLPGPPDLSCFVVDGWVSDNLS